MTELLLKPLKLACFLMIAALFFACSEEESKKEASKDVPAVKTSSADSKEASQAEATDTANTIAEKDSLAPVATKTVRNPLRKKKSAAPAVTKKTTAPAAKKKVAAPKKDPSIAICKDVERSFKAIATAVSMGNSSQTYHSMSYKGKRPYTTQGDFQKAMDAKSGIRNKYKWAAVKSCKIQGSSTANLVVKLSNGLKKFRMVKESGSWKADTDPISF